MQPLRGIIFFVTRLCDAIPCVYRAHLARCVCVVPGRAPSFIRGTAPIRPYIHPRQVVQQPGRNSAQPTPNSIPRQNRHHAPAPLCNSRKDGTVAHSSGTAIVLYWSGSSVWLERLPVTQEVAGSSPVRTAYIMSCRAVTARLAPQCAFSPLDHVRTICMSITFVWVGPV